MKLINVTKALLLSGMVFAGLQQDVQAMKRAALKPSGMVTHPFASDVTKKGIYDALMALDFNTATEKAICTAVAAAVNNADVFARDEIKSMILAATAKSFGMHVAAVNTKLDNDLLCDVSAEIAAAGIAYEEWVKIFTTNSGATLKPGCDKFAEQLGELYDSIQGLIDASEAYKKSQAIVVVKQAVDKLKKDVSDGDSEHHARAQRLALMPGQLGVVETDLKLQQTALLAIKDTRAHVKQAASHVKTSATTFTSVNDL